MANTACVWSVLAAPLALGSLTACGPGVWDTDSSGGSGSGSSATVNNGLLFAGEVKRSSAKVAPVAGGTLLIAKDGRAVAADPDRDQVHVVDLQSLKVQSVQLEEGDEPGRVVDGPSGTAYVAARRGGVVVVVDLTAGTAQRIAVCAAPRGLAYDGPHDKLFVACRSGLLAVIDTNSNEVIERFRLEPDLRDVVLAGDELVVTRFKSAEVLVVSRRGELLRRSQPDVTKPQRMGAAVTPSVAYRALSAPGGGVLVGHVDASNGLLPSGAGAYYGAQCAGSVADMSLSVVETAAPSAPSQPGSTPPAPQVELATRFSQALGGMAGPLDMAISPDGSRFALVSVGNSWAPKPTNGSTDAPTLFLANSRALSQQTGLNTCGGSGESVEKTRTEGEAVAVAFDRDGGWVVQSREPAQLQLQNGAVIALAADSRFDTGLAMFHMNTGGGIACSSCHPEGGEDGHAWNFSAGLRRSQSLEGGVSTRAPFHWLGDLPSFDELFDEVMIKRMALRASVSAEQRGALRDWLDSVPRQATADDLDPESVKRGQTLFGSAKTACSTCHGGSDYTDNLAHDVGTGSAFVTPSLLGVGLRAPLFHDGCAATLTARFGACGGGDAHGITSHLTTEDRADLVAFMQSL
ncbi:MAG TPA: c-type cytochrome [Polyangiaceae bacterium]